MIARPLTLVTFAGLLAQPGDFRVSLTATVVAAEAPRADALGCQTVHLKWRKRTGATGYVVYSSPASDGPWSPLPTSTACGAVRQPNSTSVLDAEPTRGGATVVRRLFYKVAALDGARVIDSTDVIPVELTTGR
jgi:hypothetical protein